MNPDLSHLFGAIAFDFDGTLVDTLHLHYEAYRRVFEGMGMNLSEEVFYSNIGGKATEAIPLFLGGRDAPLPVSEIHRLKKQEIEYLFRTSPLRVLPAAGLLPLLTGRLPLALVSSGSRAGIEQLLDRLAWSDFFSVIVTGEDTVRSKPDPQPYILAAEKLGIDPASIAVFEDTDAGITSAREAGMAVFNVSGNRSILWQS